jgi:predicted PurR-regulated permease PerM
MSLTQNEKDAARDEDRAERMRRLLVAASLAVVLYLVWRIAGPFVEALAWAVILALSLAPLHGFVKARLVKNETGAALVTTLLITFVLLLPIFALVYVVGREAEQTAVNLSELVRGDRGLRLIEKVRSVPYGGKKLATMMEEMRADPALVNAFVEQHRTQILNLGSGLVNGLSSLAFNAAIAIFTSYFLFRHGETVGRDLRRGLRRLAGEKMVPLLRQIRETVRGVVYGSVLTGGAQAVAATIGFWICGVPIPILLGVLTLLLSFVPFGPPLVWIPASLYLFAHGETFWGTVSLLWGAAVVSMLDNILRPIFIGKSAEIPIYLVFIAVLGGIISFGFIGIFVGPVVVAVALALWREWVASESVHTIQMPITGEFPTPGGDAALEATGAANGAAAKSAPVAPPSKSDVKR